MAQVLKSSPVEPNVRERLLKAATELFAQKGYASTSVNEIVAAAGVTKPILYYYFNSKEGIYLEIMRDAFGRFEGLVDEAEKWEGPAIARIHRLTASLLDLFVEKLDAARVIHSIYYGPPQGAPFYDFDAHQIRYLKALQHIVEDGIQSGELREANPEEITLAVAGLANISMDLELWGKGPTLGRQGLEKILKMLFRGIALHPEDHEESHEESKP
jgi:AcrR family transcriptional regulator